MTAGQRRDPITIQKLKTEQNQLGEMEVEDEAKWIDYFPCFAEVLVKGQREFVRAGIIDADVSHLVRVPYSSETIAVTSKMRIVLHVTGEKLHVMDAYRRNATNREVEILCRS
jgi:SPP1 family predicted phage head-tail adaptor